MALLDRQENRNTPRLTIAFCLVMSLLSASGCNVRTGSFSFSSGNGRSMTIRGSGESREIAVRINDGQTKTELHSKGRIEFSSDDSGVEKVAANGRSRGIGDQAPILHEHARETPTTAYRTVVEV